jgi:hypothetical protein
MDTLYLGTPFQKLQTFGKVKQFDNQYITIKIPLSILWNNLA